MDEILNNQLLFAISRNARFYYLRGTPFRYTILRCWQKFIIDENKVHNYNKVTFYNTFENVFDEIINDPKIDNEIKTNIIFHINDLKNLIAF